MLTETLPTTTHQFDVEDVEYLRHGDQPLAFLALPAAW